MGCHEDLKATALNPNSLAAAPILPTPLHTASCASPLNKKPVMSQVPGGHAKDPRVHVDEPFAGIRQPCCSSHTAQSSPCSVMRHPADALGSSAPIL